MSDKVKNDEWTFQKQTEVLDDLSRQWERGEAPTRWKPGWKETETQRRQQRWLKKSPNFGWKDFGPKSALIVINPLSEHHLFSTTSPNEGS